MMEYGLILLPAFYYIHLNLKSFYFDEPTTTTFKKE